MRRSWFKVHHLWFTSHSHRGLNGDALYIGLVMLAIADADPEWRDVGFARVLEPDGTPSTAKTIGKFARTRLDRTKKSIKSLEECGTIEIKSDGTIVVPNFRKWQEDRTSKAKRTIRSTGIVNKKSTGEEEAEEEGIIIRSNSAKPAPKKPTKSADWLTRSAGLGPTELAEVVLRWISAARKTKGIRVRGVYRATPKRVKHITARIDDGATLQDWWRVIQRQAHKSSHSEAQQYLTPETLMRPDNFERVAGWDHIEVMPMPDPKTCPESPEDRSPDVFPRGRYQHGRWQLKASREAMWLDCSETEAKACLNMS